MKTNLSKQIASLICEQIRKEYESSYLYLQIADYYDKNNLHGFAVWFTIQAREEIDHALIFMKYLHATNTEIQFFPIQPFSLTVKSIRDPLDLSLRHEKFVTDSINKIYMAAENEKDYRTQMFLSWFIDEQLEEETSAQNLLDSYDFFASENANEKNECKCKSALYQLDKKYGERKYKSSDKLIA